MPSPSTLRVAPGIEIPVEEIELRTSRSSGPGGQHANVTESRVEAVFDVAGSATLSDLHKARLLEQLGPRVSAVAQDARSQARNRELALERLRERLADALHVPKQRRPTRPSRSARAKRVESKRLTSERKRQRRRPEPGVD
ncbi:MAG: ribosome-associated protein [Solirubrobacterales bacterium]|jgi:ribosome-associated protein|nr:ribosome-associated protein [Solirubrobacterales bacterium]MDX6651304.1 ribosome-associated protein [Solirubrobacterales bacterium]